MTEEQQIDLDMTLHAIETAVRELWPLSESDEGLEHLARDAGRVFGAVSAMYLIGKRVEAHMKRSQLRVV